MSVHSSGLTRRQALRYAGLAAAVACVPTQARTTPAPLQIVGPWEIVGLHPASSGYIFTRLQVAETLIGAADDGSPEPALARRWEVSGDGLTWRFELRDTARFHDGSAVTASAVLRCLEAARTPPSLLSAAPIRSMGSEGERVVVIRLKERHAVLPALLAHSSTLVLAPSSFDGTGQVRRIVGSGPYRIVSLTPPQQLETAAFEDFDGPRPAIERVRYLAAGRAETRALMAEAGQADLAYGLDPASLQRLRLRPNVRVETVTLPRTVILKLNAGISPLNDVRVRRALSLCIDRAGIARALLRDPELAATQLFPPTLAGWHDPSLPALAYDPAEAARLLAQAGWRLGRDGLHDAHGAPLQLSLRTFPDRPELPLIATALQASWRQAGIAVKVSVGNSGDIPLGHRDGSLQLGLAARHYANVPNPTSTLLQDFGPRGGDWGAMGWASDHVSSALTELARGAISSERERALRRQVASILQAELPVVPIAWYRQQVAASRRVSGVSLDPLERSYRITAMRWNA
ncbi:MAG: ABC transporter substrate-binding protein [Caldimonas sp.]|uniref:ABC transporter substrate-binding protein n=1 Tax=Caldimonas taiwanensis TaxID=307483 RepID=UPI0007855E53|nr:ABC transporter substrate-binding protein [Caldimonas taiwanensis]GIX23579.1 MAG: ABC transporter substrate-binding protein [Caldimonas sp.]